MDPRRRPSSTTPSSDARVPQLGKKRPHDGVEGADSGGADHPHKAPKSTEGATPASLAAPPAAAVAGADANDEEAKQQQQLKERLQKVEERLEGCEEVTAFRSDVDKGATRIDATVVSVANLEKKEKERTERGQAAAAAAPPTWKGGGSSTSDMDLDKSDEDDKANANAEKFDILERRIQQMEASGSPELLVSDSLRILSFSLVFAPRG